MIQSVGVREMTNRIINLIKSFLLRFKKSYYVTEDTDGLITVRQYYRLDKNGISILCSETIEVSGTWINSNGGSYGPPN